MNKKFFVCALVVTAALFLACAGPVEGQGRKIIDIQVKGNYYVSAATILNKLKMQPGDDFEQIALNKEIKRVYAMGYFSDVYVEVEDRPGGVIVVLNVVEKPTITSIQFQGNARLNSSKLRKKLTIKEGDLLDFNQVAQNVADLKSYYTEEGYSRASVEYKIETDETGQKGDVIFIIDEGIPLKVRSVNVEGNKFLSANEIKNYMATKTSWWFLRKGSFDTATFDGDLARIAAAYRQKGFLDAKVTSELDYSEDQQALHITVIVDEGKRYKAGDIIIEGELAFPEQEVYSNIKMKTGDPFDYEAMKEDMEALRMFYYDRGYMDAEINLQHRYNPQTDSMDLVYTIVSHDVISVGKVNIIGNTKTRDKVIRREIRVYPGEQYDGQKLKKSKERIYNLGYFEDVYFETTPTDTEDVKDLDVTVKETKTGEFSFGGGYSSIESFIGFVQIRQKNFDIMDFPTFTGAGQNLVIRAELGSARSNYFLSWTDPWIFDLPYLFGFDVYREEHDSYSKSGYGYDERRMGGNLRFGKEINDYLYTGLVYNLEEVKISNIPDNASDDLRKEVGSNWISSLTWSMSYDRRDNRFSPTKGYYATVAVKDAGGFLGGDKDFVKGYGGAAYYHSIIKNVVLEVKGTVGLAGPYGDSDELPIYERFFAGGATTIRGYKERGVGPRDPGSDSALGGEALVVGNAEVVFPIYKNIIKGAVFYDVGNVWGDNKDIFTNKGEGYKSGTGLGVRVKTPIGPVQLDWGYPLNENHNDKKEGRFYFNVSHGF